LSIEDREGDNFSERAKLCFFITAIDWELQEINLACPQSPIVKNSDLCPVYKQSMQLPAPRAAKHSKHANHPTPGAAQIPPQAASAAAQPIFFQVEHPDAITESVDAIAILVSLTFRRTGWA
jgi:hypothetical protein